MPYQSVFTQTFDIAIYGCGYSGLAAAWKLRDAGKHVLLFDRHFDVAWESGRSFVRTAGECQNASWRTFCEATIAHSGYEGSDLDPVSAEVMACCELRAERGSLETLLGAAPISGMMRGDDLTEISVATKSGERTLRARVWIDASDTATLHQLAQPTAYERRRSASAYEHRVLLALNGEDAFPTQAFEHSGEAIHIERVPHGLTLSLCISSSTPLSPRDLLEKYTALREANSDAFGKSSVLCFASRPYPVYGQTDTPAASGVAPLGNLYAASPALTGVPVRTLSERYALGLDLANRVEIPSTDTVGSERKISLPVREADCEILVAGLGTGGSMAALEACKLGRKVLLADSGNVLGGIGTAGQICVYFHGQKGGGFESLDQASETVQHKLGPKILMGLGWLSDSKALALENEYATNSPELLRESIVYAVKTENGRITQASIATPEGILCVRTEAVIDGTGDGDLAVLAGAAYDFGRPVDGLPLSYSQPSMALNTEKQKVKTFNFDAGWVDPTDPEDLSRARITAISMYRNVTPWPEMTLIQLAPLLGLRQSRQIHTRSRLTLQDLLNNTQREDSIGAARSPLDTHSVDFEFEDDETFFWLWSCKSFRPMTYCDMPHGVMTPDGIDNLWLACRAAGVTTNAAYAVRMQRDIHRMGEAAAYSADAWLSGHTPEEIIKECQRKLDATGARQPVPEAAKESDTAMDPLAILDSGEADRHLWRIYQNRERYEAAILERLDHSNSHVSWLAATILAMWQDPRAEPRLIQAIESREEGNSGFVSGAFNQNIGVPNWYLAINLLRRCGSEQCLDALQAVAEQPANCLNLRTALAITLTRLARPDASSGAKRQAAAILRALSTDDIPDAYTRPSHAISLGLKGEPQPILGNEPPGVDTREDHTWQVVLTQQQAYQAWGLPSPLDISPHLEDSRAIVRKAFSRLP
ncbi:FAD-dependent oxidoreductase [Ruficoccus sp. ZRK36]|uniref:FAD-dependent oxidoreductase n=1 Tax=Ruficoccus sp. ZRK36 TaxID=2866311 RepID=UPI001C7363C2|nr:FAD-dependent oxidoreductase [Ruficoccus sp. ZRK36]QYY35050.1 FAD-dependent oxidoreductase [Ruficoccus sp. ZRK36]